MTAPTDRPATPPDSPDPTGAAADAAPGRTGRLPWRLITGIGLGAVAGFAYYYFIGCASGGCPITSNPWISTGYGGLLGFLLAGGSPCGGGSCAR